jgi:hypothetical protein
LFKPRASNKFEDLGPLIQRLGDAPEQKAALNHTTASWSNMLSLRDILDFLGAWLLSRSEPAHRPA